MNFKGKKKWKWKEEHQKTFEKLKNKITSQLVLALPRKEGKFRVEIDTSEHTIKGVLSQKEIETNHIFIKDNTSS